MSARHRTPAWRSVRRRALERDGWRCVRCRSGLGLEVHHKDRTPEAFYRLDAVETLCRACHIGEHREERLAGRSQAARAWDRAVTQLQGR